MATSKVGVRDLKLHAPALVRRAAEGERIVITRYGRDEAVLGPVGGTGEPPWAENPRTAPWERERRAFERLAPKLARRYAGRYVAILGGRVADADADHDALFERMWRKHAPRAFFIGRPGGAPPVVEMPGFEVG